LPLLTFGCPSNNALGGPKKVSYQHIFFLSRALNRTFCNSVGGRTTGLQTHS